MRYAFAPWDDVSDLENHYCHHHEMFYDDLTGIPVCPICRNAKVQAHLKKQTIQNEINDERNVPQET